MVVVLPGSLRRKRLLFPFQQGAVAAWTDKDALSGADAAVVSCPEWVSPPVATAVPLHCLAVC